MSSCSCSALVSVTFGNGTVLLRCVEHEAQTWLVDGQPVDSAEAVCRLRELFLDRRGKQRRPARTPAPAPAPRAEKVIELERPVHETTPQPVLGEHADEQLTALLRAHGAQGSWAVA